MPVLESKPSAVTLRFVDELAGLEPLRSFWVAHQQHPNVEFEFYQEVIRQRTPRVRPLVMVWEQAEQPVALLAGRIEEEREPIRFGYRTWPGWRRRMFCSVTGGLLGEIVPDRTLPALATALERYRLDYAVLSNLPVGCPMGAAIEKQVPAWRRDHAARTNAHWQMSLPATFEEFLGRRKKKHRYWLQRLGRVLERDYPGRVRLARFRDPVTVEEFCRDAAQLSARTYQRQLGAGFTGNEEARRHCALLATDGRWRGYILYVDEEPRAYWLAAVIGPTLFLFSTGYDPDFRKYEVGTVLFLEMIADACREGLARVDFGLGAAAYKERFGDEHWEEKHFYVFAPTWRGALLNSQVTVNRLVENSARWVLAQAQLVAKTKRAWRQRLAKSDAAAGNTARDDSAD